MTQGIKILLLLVSCIILACSANTKNVYQPNSEYGIDTYISKTRVNQNFSQDYKLNAFGGIANSSVSDINRFLLKIRCSSIPVNVTVDSAFVYLKIVEIKKAGQDTSFYIERILEDWDAECVTWANQPKSDSKNSIKVKITNDQLDYYKIDITKFIKDIANQDYLNYGFLFKSGKESNVNGISFYSSNAKDLDNQPRLLVYYKHNSI